MFDELKRRWKQDDERTTESFIEWRNRPPARKTAWVAAVVLPALIAGWLWMHSLEALGGPFARMVGRANLAGALALLLVLAICALAVRRGWKARWTPLLLAAVCGSYLAAMMLLTGGGGRLASLLFFCVLLAGLLAAFCFDGVLGLCLLMLSFGILVLNNVFRFAPELTSSVEEDAALQIMTALVTGTLVMTNVLVVALVLAAQRLMETRLKRSHDLLRRYVPGQLADRILAGGHDVAAKHERRKLTIVFSDVVGFTGLSDELDAEELATLLNEYLAEMMQIADRYGATVNQIIGDGIMMFFGAPVVTDDRDHALRAVRMAQDMQQRMVELRAEWFSRGVQRPFHARIGINTGFASVGDFGSPGRMTHSAIGQQTNLAARIQAQCESDRVLLSHSTWGLVQDEIACAPKGELQVKGLHYPVLVYEVAESVERAA